jgi:hypothetical protein
MSAKTEKTWMIISAAAFGGYVVFLFWSGLHFR